MTQGKGISYASHDVTVDRAREAIVEWVVLAEFPTTIDAAKESYRHGLLILMGALKLILGVFILVMFWRWN